MRRVGRLAGGGGPPAAQDGELRVLHSMARPEEPAAVGAPGLPVAGASVPRRPTGACYFSYPKSYAFAWLPIVAAGITCATARVGSKPLATSPAPVLLAVMVPPVVVNFWLRMGKLRLTLSGHRAAPRVYQHACETANAFLPSCNEPVEKTTLLGRCSAIQAASGCTRVPIGVDVHPDMKPGWLGYKSRYMPCSRLAEAREQHRRSLWPSSPACSPAHNGGTRLGDAGRAAHDPLRRKFHPSHRHLPARLPHHRDGARRTPQPARITEGATR